ncbi:MAG: hypothetical protein ABJF11_18025 [Reichenbachiella sp.]|uniref:hypothetical protein n=1 Tax=Reichenbachiella sp. TaxID=2184521 RepID=UPI00326651B7
MDLIKRIPSYLLLGLLASAIPYFVTVALIMATGDRIDGMKMGVFPGVVLVHVLFGIYILKYKWLLKSVLILALTVLVFSLLMLLMQLGWVLRPGWDIYGYWDLVVTNYVVGFFVWESFFQIAPQFMNKSQPLK